MVMALKSVVSLMEMMIRCRDVYDYLNYCDVRGGLDELDVRGSVSFSVFFAISLIYTISFQFVCFFSSGEKDSFMKHNFVKCTSNLAYST